MTDSRPYHKQAVSGSERLQWAKEAVVKAAVKHYDYPAERVYRVALGARLRELRELEAVIAVRDAASDRSGAQQRLTRGEK